LINEDFVAQMVFNEKCLDLIGSSHIGANNLQVAAGDMLTTEYAV
jgi:hypothetical protein